MKWHTKFPFCLGNPCSCFLDVDRESLKKRPRRRIVRAPDRFLGNGR